MWKYIAEQFWANDWLVTQKSRCHQQHRPLMTSWKGIHGALSKMYTSSNNWSSVFSFAGMRYDFIQCRKKWWFRLFQTCFFLHRVLTQVLFSSFAGCCACDGRGIICTTNNIGSYDVVFTILCILLISCFLPYDGSHRMLMYKLTNQGIIWCIQHGSGIFIHGISSNICMLFFCNVFQSE